MKKLKFWAWILLAVLVAIVVLQNTDTVTTKILFIDVAMPRALFLVVNLLLGFVLGYGFARYRTRGRVK